MPRRPTQPDPGKLLDNAARDLSREQLHELLTQTLERLDQEVCDFLRGRAQDLSHAIWSAAGQHAAGEIDYLRRVRAQLAARRDLIGAQLAAERRESTEP